MMISIWCHDAPERKPGKFQAGAPGNGGASILLAIVSRRMRLRGFSYPDPGGMISTGVQAISSQGE